MFGVIGLLLGLFALPDIAMLIIQISQYGFLTGYAVCFGLALILFWCGLLLMSSGKKDT